MVLFFQHFLSLKILQPELVNAGIVVPCTR